MAEKRRRRVRGRKERLSGMPAEILDIEGAGKLLGVSPTTVYRLARAGKLPGTKIGREWRFVRASLIEWVASGGKADQVLAFLNKGKPAKRS